MKTRYIDKEEKELMGSLNDVDLTQITTDIQNTKQLQKAAQSVVKKSETKMNIRISTTELKKIKAKAEQEGLKYQTLIKSILHKYITGQLVEKKHRLLKN